MKAEVKIINFGQKVRIPSKIQSRIVYKIEQNIYGIKLKQLNFTEMIYLHCFFVL